MKNVDYLWEVRSTGGRMIDMRQLASGEVSYKDGQMIIRDVKPSYGTLKGRCIIVDRETKQHFPSPFFNFAVPPTFKPEDIMDLPKMVDIASCTLRLLLNIFKRDYLNNWLPRN